MRGKITMEEAYALPDDYEESKRNAALFLAPSECDRYMRQISDIDSVDTPERVKLADSLGIGYTIISQTVPGIQGIADPAKAEARATEVNDWAAARVRRCPNQLGAF